MVANRLRMMTKVCAELVAGADDSASSGVRWLVTNCRPLRRTVDTKGEAGFTLVEVIVALAMLSMGLSLLLGLISSSLRRTAAAERMAEAGSLAQSLLAEVGASLPIKAEERGGLYPNGYRWHLKMLPYEDSKEREDWPVGLFLISTEVEWGEGAEKRSYVLKTLRLAPKASRP